MPGDSLGVVLCPSPLCLKVVGLIEQARASALRGGAATDGTWTLRLALRSLHHWKLIFQPGARVLVLVLPRLPLPSLGRRIVRCIANASAQSFRAWSGLVTIWALTAIRLCLSVEATALTFIICTCQSSCTAISPGLSPL